MNSGDCRDGPFKDDVFGLLHVDARLFEFIEHGGKHAHAVEVSHDEHVSRGRLLRQGAVGRHRRFQRADRVAAGRVRHAPHRRVDQSGA